MILAILWAIVAMLAAAASLVLLVTSTTRVGALRPIVRAVDAETQRPGIRDGDLAQRLAGHPVPGRVTVSAGSRHGTGLTIAAAAGLVLTFVAVVTGSGFTALLATVSAGLSVYVGVRFGNARQLRADRDRIRLRRWQISAEIPMTAVRGLGFVPAPDGRVWISLWCDASAVSGLPEPLTESAVVEAEMCWLRLDPIETVSTAQLLRLWQFFEDRWFVGGVDGQVRSEPPKLPELFATGERFGFDMDGTYRVDGVPVAYVVQRRRSRPQLLRAKLMRAVDKLPHVFEVRDARLRTRWVISKPDATWKTAFYVTDRHGQRVGTLRAVSVASRNFDLCGTDNQVLATLRPGQPRTTVVDNSGRTIAVWDVRSGELFSDAEPSLRTLCLLSPIVARFAGTAGAICPGGETVALAATPHVPDEPPADDATVELNAAGPEPDGHGPGADDVTVAVTRPDETGPREAEAAVPGSVEPEAEPGPAASEPAEATVVMARQQREPEPQRAGTAGADSAQDPARPGVATEAAVPGSVEPEAEPGQTDSVRADADADATVAVARPGGGAEAGPADDGRSDSVRADADAPPGVTEAPAQEPVPDPMSPLWPNPPRG